MFYEEMEVGWVVWFVELEWCCMYCELVVELYGWLMKCDWCIIDRFFGGS